jgi:O-acetyl-ADP-ribose deacetylase (regulator of RNase III)
MNHIEIIIGDITNASVDAIVNAANPRMLGGGGVDGAIHRAAGPRLLEACKKIEAIDGVRCPFGSARITPAGDLAAKYVIHAVGPIYHNEAHPEALLKQTYVSVLDLAIQNSCCSIAIPAISCGAYGFPIDLASVIAINTCAQYPKLQIKFYLLDQNALSAWRNAIAA